jgi:hypothetical protein
MRSVWRQDQSLVRRREGRVRSTNAKLNNYVRSARRKWPRAIWIIGDGPYASVSRCPPGETIMLLDTMAEAEMFKTFMDNTGCCEGCRRDHLTMELRQGAARKKPAG